MIVYGSVYIIDCLWRWQIYVTLRSDKSLIYWNLILQRSQVKPYLWSVSSIIFSRKIHDSHDSVIFLIPIDSDLSTFIQVPQSVDLR